MKEINLRNLKQLVGFYPHEKQVEILTNLNRFTIVVGGKRLGKTILASYLALKELFGSYKSIWVIAPTHDLTSRIWEYLDLWIYRDLGGDQGPFRINKHEKIIENVLTRSKLWTKSGENPQSLLGKGLDLAIIDEASRLDGSLWKGYIEPNLMDHGGRGFFISNPYGFNWFYDLYLLGTQEGQLDNPLFTSFVVPTAVEDMLGNVVGSNNPAIKLEELQRIKKTTAPDIWRQEYLSVFQEGVGVRFKNIEQCVDNSIKIQDPNEWFENPINGHLYMIGVDIAKVEDFSVITVVDRMTHRVVGFYRINNLSWEFIRDKVRRTYEKYNFATVVLDATGGGDVFSEDLKNTNVDVLDFKYTNRSKVQLIDKLAMLIDAGNIRFPKIPALINELKAFTYHFSNSGNLIYGSSKKDDCVNSLALACWELLESPLENTTYQGAFMPRRRSMK